jgi:hypothetical protein
MRMHKRNFTYGLSLIFCFMASTVLMAQGQPQMKTDFSDDELSLFIDANKEVVRVQQDAEQKMIQSIQQTDGITVERFNKIAMAQQNPDASVDMSDQEKMAFQNAAQGVMEVQRETQAKIAAVVEDKGMAFNDYRQIMLAYQQSPELQEKIRAMVEEQQN